MFDFHINMRVFCNPSNLGMLALERFPVGTSDPWTDRDTGRVNFSAKS